MGSGPSEIQDKPPARSSLAPEAAVGGHGDGPAHLEEEGQVVDRVAVEGAVGEGDAAGVRVGEDGVALGRAEKGGSVEPARASPFLVFEGAREDCIGADQLGQGPYDKIERRSREDDGSAISLDRSDKLEQLGTQRLAGPSLEDLSAYVFEQSLLYALDPGELALEEGGPPFPEAIGRIIEG